MLSILRHYSNEGENTTEEAGECMILYFLHKKYLRVRSVIFSILYQMKYSNGFSTEPKYKTMLKVSVLIANLPGKILLITKEHNKLQKTTPIFNTYSKKKSMAQIK